MTTRIETFTYDDAIVRKFLLATLIWGAVGMLVGVLVAVQLAFPGANLGLPWTSFGRLRPLHTNAVIFTRSPGTCCSPGSTTRPSDSSRPGCSRTS